MKDKYGNEVDDTLDAAKLMQDTTNEGGEKLKQAEYGMAGQSVEDTIAAAKAAKDALVQGDAAARKEDMYRVDQGLGATMGGAGKLGTGGAQASTVADVAEKGQMAADAGSATRQAAINSASMKAAGAGLEGAKAMNEVGSALENQQKQMAAVESAINSGVSAAKHWYGDNDTDAVRNLEALKSQFSNPQALARIQKSIDDINTGKWDY